MAKSKRKAVYTPNPRYTQEDWDEVSDNPELTDEEIAELRPASEVLPPALYEALAERARRRTLPVTLNVEVEVFEAFRAEGDDWERRMADALRKAVGR